MTPLRRKLVLGTLAAIAAPSLFAGQGAPSAPRVAIVFNGAPDTHGVFLEAFLRGVNELGYANGHSVALDVRWANSQLHRLPEIIAGLLDRKPDVLAVAGSQAIRAAKDASGSIPIVMASVGDPVGQGLIVSL